MYSVLTAIISLGSIGAVSAVILYFVARKFNVYEDPRNAAVAEVLPGDNCGGCGFPGCTGFADACVKSDSLEGLMCPVGGSRVMSAVAGILGKESTAAEPETAVVRCSGNCENRARTNLYDGARSCAIVSSLYRGETGCPYGCLGCGDCADACPFGAIRIDRETLLPVVNEARCTACGTCVRTCPKNIIEMRKKGPKSRRIFVSCVNRDKGAIARKACTAACIGCGKCEKSCSFGAITVSDNVAYIDDKLCHLCRKCVEACPTGSIQALNFPPRRNESTERDSTPTMQ